MKPLSWLFCSLFIDTDPLTRNCFSRDSFRNSRRSFSCCLHLAWRSFTNTSLAVSCALHAVSDYLRCLCYLSNCRNTTFLFYSLSCQMSLNILSSDSISLGDRSESPEVSPRRGVTASATSIGVALTDDIWDRWLLIKSIGVFSLSVWKLPSFPGGGCLSASACSFLCQADWFF